MEDCTILTSCRWCSRAPIINCDPKRRRERPWHVMIRITWPSTSRKKWPSCSCLRSHSTESPKCSSKSWFLRKDSARMHALRSLMITAWAIFIRKAWSDFWSLRASITRRLRISVPWLGGLTSMRTRRSASKSSSRLSSRKSLFLRCSYVKELLQSEPGVKKPSTIAPRGGEEQLPDLEATQRSSSTRTIRQLWSYSSKMPLTHLPLTRTTDKIRKVALHPSDFVRWLIVKASKKKTTTIGSTSMKNVSLPTMMEVKPGLAIVAKAGRPLTFRVP